MRSYTLLLRLLTGTLLLSANARAGVYEFMQDGSEANFGDSRLLGYYAIAFCVFMALKALRGHSDWRQRLIRSAAYACAAGLFVWLPMLGGALVFAWATLAILVLASGK